MLLPAGSAARMRLLFLVVCVGLLIGPSAAQGPETVPRFGIYELFVAEAVPPHVNPFNRSQWKAWAVIQAPEPAAAHVTVHGFYFQNYTRSQDNGKVEHLAPFGSAGVAVRYVPTSVGTHQVALYVNGTLRTTTSFSCVASQMKNGTVQLGPHRQHFVTPDGADFLPVGLNIGWPDNGQGTYYYDWYLPQLSQGGDGGNYFRIWVGPSVSGSFPFLSLQQRFGEVDQPTAWRVDYILQLAARYHVRVLLAFESFNSLCLTTTPYCPWGQSAYNRANGGPLSSPTDFWSNQLAAEEFRQRLDYIVARYGVYSSVFSWQLFNEVDLTEPIPARARARTTTTTAAADCSDVPPSADYTCQQQQSWGKCTMPWMVGYCCKTCFNCTIGCGSKRTAKDDWLVGMAKYLRGIDPYYHLVSNSYSNSNGDPFSDSDAAFDFTTTHDYNTPDLARSTAMYCKQKAEAYGKPTFVGEFGCDAGGDNKTVITPIGQRNGLWAPLFQLGAGTGMSWWWELAQSDGLLANLKPVAEFGRRVHWNAHRWQAVNVTVTGGGNGAAVTLLGVAAVSPVAPKAAIALLFIHGNAYTCYAKSYPEIDALELSITPVVCGGGPLVINWFNTTTGADIGTGPVSCQDGLLKVQSPPFSDNLAGYVAPQ